MAVVLPLLISSASKMHVQTSISSYPIKELLDEGKTTQFGFHLFQLPDCHNHFSECSIDEIVRSFSQYKEIGMGQFGRTQQHINRIGGFYCDFIYNLECSAAERHISILLRFTRLPIQKHAMCQFHFLFLPQSNVSGRQFLAHIHWILFGYSSTLFPLLYKFPIN